MQEIRSKVETYYDSEEDDMTQQAEVTFEQGGSRWRRTRGGYFFRDGRRVSRAEFDEARGTHYEELGARLAEVADEASGAASVSREDDAPAQAPTSAPEADGGDTGAREKRPRKRRPRDVAFEHAPSGVTLTARQCEFLRAASGCPCWAEGDGTLWTDVLLDELGMNGMSFGAMVSTLREKGLIQVWAESREDGATGRSRKVKAMRLTERGERVLRAAGYRLPGRWAGSVKKVLDNPRPAWYTGIVKGKGPI